VYTDPRVVEFVQQHFTPVRAHVRENGDEFKRLGSRFNAQWTPTILIVDSEGNERHRIEGFLPADDFLAQLTLGLAKSAFARGKFDEAERYFRSVVDAHPDTEAAPEALYWAGVSRYKDANDASALGATARAFSTRYTDTSWAKKASVWNK
jgi:Tetratricopeptide repeat/Thioredoxin-like domain